MRGALCQLRSERESRWENRRLPNSGGPPTLPLATGSSGMSISLQVARAPLQLRSFCGLTALQPHVLKAAQFGAEAEAIDAELERGAVAVEEALEKGFELEGARDVLLDFDELASG